MLPEAAACSDSARKPAESCGRKRRRNIEPSSAKVSRRLVPASPLGQGASDVRVVAEPVGDLPSLEETALEEPAQLQSGTPNTAAPPGKGQGLWRLLATDQTGSGPGDAGCASAPEAGEAWQSWSPPPPPTPEASRPDELGDDGAAAAAAGEGSPSPVACAPAAAAAMPPPAAPRAAVAPSPAAVGEAGRLSSSLLARLRLACETPCFNKNVALAYQLQSVAAP